VRLAAQLTGWRIDIHSESKHGEMLDTSRREIGRVTMLDHDMVEALVRAGFQNAQEIADAEPAEIAAILEVEADVAEAVVRGADDVVGQLIEEETQRRKHEPEPEVVAEPDVPSGAVEGEPADGAEAAPEATAPTE
jgi:N utilization substance protein A